MEKKIVVCATIHADSLGEGWRDQNEAADALAALSEKIWRKDLERYEAQGFVLDFGIDVEPSGCGGGVEVHTEGDDDGESAVDAQEVEAVLTKQDQIWELFLSSESDDLAL